MTDFNQLSQDYYRIEEAIRFLERNFRHQPTLTEIAEHVRLSEFHFQRLFSRWVGISPKRFLQFLTKQYAKKLLAESRNLLEVSYGSGLSGPGRLHDLLISCEAVTPGEYQKSGAGLTITYGFHPSPFGECLIAQTERGICNLRFVNRGNHAELLAALKKQFQKSNIVEDPGATEPLVEQIFGFAGNSPAAPLHLYVKGTNFQIKVWEALLKIPLGAVVSYQDIARQIGMPQASRAVGNAVGQNPVPFLIPCHRVIKKSGDFGNYGEGPARKKAILGWEAAQKIKEEK